MQFIDIVIILLAVVALLRGAETGLVRQAATLMGIIGGILIGSGVSNLLDGSALASLIIIIFTVGITMGISEAIGSRLADTVAKIRLQAINQILGAALGFAGLLIIVWLGASMAGALPSTQLKTDIRDSKIITWLDESLPPSTSILSWINGSLAQTKLPDIIKEFEPALPETTVNLPARSEFSGVLAAHRDAVVEIEGRTCGGIGVGSGFIAKNNVVITNAHVVAGMRYPYIKDSNGRHRTEVIGFNPSLDIAILRTGDLAGKPIPLATSVVPNGTQAIAIGYPGGGPQTASPAAIVDIFNANSRDIYNESTTERTLYTMRANINPGNSGGPLIDTSGSVVGVIFAKSTTYNQVGYAIAMPEVIQELNRALKQPTAKDNLRCAAN